MAEVGLCPEDFEAAEIALWPDNVVTKEVFAAMGSQWRISVGGPTGLDYGVLPVVLRMAGVPRREWSDVFDGLRVMESAALDVLHARQ